ncbi:alpha/beta-hydrolase [Testicularia cyperi]|uniref:Alpha/beta-hydrolase n=1 Tax=Testicularia cyperi TaxID=1882483 RepID=A0A317XMT1_9BASI|nr:alpha/beta-hydrolase [Testicularia cyperi]
MPLSDEKQFVNAHYHAIDANLPRATLDGPLADSDGDQRRRRTKKVPMHRWVAVLAFTIVYYVCLRRADILERFLGDRSDRNGHHHHHHHHHPHNHAISGLKPLHQTHFADAARGEIVWHDCGDKDTYPAPLKCGRMKAPLDYANEQGDGRNAEISIIFYPAGGDANPTPKEEVLGTLITNPGGPGGSGVGFMTRKVPERNNTVLAAKFDTIFDGRYNIASFDPRGVGRTFPRIDCWNATEKSYISRIENDAMGILYSHPGGEDAEIGARIASNQLLTDLCHTNPYTAEMVKFVGTTAVARDMQLLHRALGDDKLTYWGFSYGTVLGSTFADRHPDDVHRLAIDGVVDVPNYMQGLWSDNLKDTDGDFFGFFDECVKAGPEACKFSSQATSAKKLQHKYMELLESLKLYPRPVVDADVPQLLTFTKLLEATFTILYKPANWPKFADQLNDIMNGNATAFINAYGDPVYRKPDVPESEEANIAIACGDALLESTDEPISIAKAKKFIGSLEKDSGLFGQMFSDHGLHCLHSWKPRSTQRHYGDFTSKTSFPILALGNEFDPVTPGRYADKMADLFPNAVSVQRKGYGHCTLSQPSKCIEKILHDYFVDGVVPKKGINCDVDGSPFPAPGKNASSLGVQDTRQMEISRAFADIHDAVLEINTRRRL